MWKFSTSWMARTSAPLLPCVINRPMGNPPLSVPDGSKEPQSRVTHVGFVRQRALSRICRVPLRQQGIRTFHVPARRITPILQFPRPLERFLPPVRRAEHDDQLKAAAFGRRQVGDE